MGRLATNTAEYFPHFAKRGKTLDILETKWQNNGYAFWFKLLESLCTADNHFLDTKNPLIWEHLLARTHVDAISGTEILALLAKLGNIDEQLWQQARIIWCPALVENLENVYKKRKRPLPTRPSIIHNDSSFHQESPAAPISGTEMPPQPDCCSENATKKRKEKKRKDNRISVPEIPLPQWLNKELWQSYLKMREDKKKSPTNGAVGLLLKRLEAFRNEGQNTDAILEQSIRNTWVDLYPVKDVQLKPAGTITSGSDTWNVRG